MSKKKLTHESFGIPCTKQEYDGITKLLKRWLKSIPEPQKSAFKTLIAGSK